MAESFPLGSLIRVEAEFHNEAGNLADPSVVKLTIITPSGTSTTYTYGSGVVQRRSTGVYFAEITGAEENKYSYRFWSPPDDPVQAAEEGHFRVRQSEFA